MPDRPDGIDTYVRRDSVGNFDSGSRGIACRGVDRPVTTPSFWSATHFTPLAIAHNIGSICHSHLEYPVSPHLDRQNERKTSVSGIHQTCRITHKPKGHLQVWCILTYSYPGLYSIEMRIPRVGEVFHVGGKNDRGFRII